MTMPGESRFRLRERKVSVMGRQTVGKTCLALQFAQREFSDHYDPTIENTFEGNLTVDGKEFLIRILDTPGQDEFSPITHEYATNYNGFIFVFAIDSEKSFEIIQRLYEKVAKETGKEVLSCILVGNKSDLETKREVKSSEGQQLAASWKTTYVETSAKDFQSVERMFETFIKTIEKDDDENEPVKPEKTCTLM